MLLLLLLLLQPACCYNRLLLQPAYCSWLLLKTPALAPCWLGPVGSGSATGQARTASQLALPRRSSLGARTATLYLAQPLSCCGPAAETMAGGAAPPSSGTDLCFLGALSAARRRVALAPRGVPSPENVVALEVVQHGCEGLHRVLWPSSERIAQWLVDHLGDGRGRGLRAIELGCGLALASRVASRLGLDALATDREAPTLAPSRWLDAVVGAAEGGPSPALSFAPSPTAWPEPAAAALDWTELDGPAAHAALARGPFDLVLAADVIYASALHAPLARTIARALTASPAAKAIVCFQVRRPALEMEFLYSVLPQHGLVAEEIGIEDERAQARQAELRGPPFPSKHVFALTRIFKVSKVSTRDSQQVEVQAEATMEARADSAVEMRAGAKAEAKVEELAEADAEAQPGAHVEAQAGAHAEAASEAHGEAEEAEAGLFL